ncbi:uncharacterized protein K452DRAFT_360718 [Aplosporella prunicola CBS 121167]|uniref:Uncharacterized protein n=1 Tax=Aplosporella prunicola CBS 121167 TaxID=1176127 RepID=A0A6A6B7N5_9PEZI|nr:uncharacterized protein K452DRAFT_360718 [Aplosporella prunicola CBS 121167]KAF2138967.1 hypothetical protein K452DRAFT_360718 [Aplosporella prunicola CBS 121167]
MPRVLSYTPAWLSRGSPGFEVFNQTSVKGKSPKATNGATKESQAGPNRTIAYRGNEVFVVAGSELRWADLIQLREFGSPNGHSEFAQSLRSSRGPREVLESVEEPEQAYRVLKTNVSGQITQLVVSPNDDYMAICTSHTVHIAVLPDPSHLSSEDNGPIRLKTFQLGPTAHVLDQAPLASVLWHPLGRHGRCLVTVTTDANVRLWEINRENRISFSEPELAVDLKKLASGIDSMEDFRAARINDKTGYTPDSFELEVASACFGASGKNKGERGWGPMTLWVAMKRGDIYALCPLLPKRWQYATQHVAPQYLRSLALPIQAKATELDEESDDTFIQTCDQQNEWLEGIRYELEEDENTGDVLEIYSRPATPGPIPRLQGPFLLDVDIDEDFKITDIAVVTSGDGSALPDIEEVRDAASDKEDPNVAVICFLTNMGKLHICLDFDGVEGQWLPKERAFTTDIYHETPCLMLFETVELLTEKPAGKLYHPLFTADAKSGSALFVSTEAGAYFVGMSSWLQPLQDELTNTETEGTGMRIDALMRGPGSLVESIITYRQDQYQEAQHLKSACVVLSNPELGYFILTAEGSQPYAASLDSPDADYDDRYALITYEHEPDKIHIPEPWPAYQPPQSLWAQSRLPPFLEEVVPSRHKHLLKQEIRLSTATLDILTKAHRVLVKETQQLGQAASSLFTRCQRLQDELRDQIRKANDAAGQIESITGEDEDDYAGNDDANGERVVGSAKIEKRIQDVRDRQRELLERTERLRAKLGRTGTRALSDRERAWFGEVDKMKEQLAREEEGEDAAAPGRRIDEVRRLRDDLVAQARELAEAQKEAEKKAEGLEEEEATAAGVVVPSEFRKEKVRQVMALLERETAMVEAATKKLRRMQVNAA